MFYFDLLRLRHAPRFRNLLEGQTSASLSRGLDKVEVPLCWKAATLKPSSRCRVRNAEVVGELRDGWPDVRNMFHAILLRSLRIIVNTQTAKCSHGHIQLPSGVVETSNA